MEMKMQPFCQHDYQESVKKNVANGQLKVWRGGGARAHKYRTTFSSPNDEEITIKRIKAKRHAKPAPDHLLSGH